MQGLLLILLGLAGLILLINDKLNSNPYSGLGELQTQWVKSLQKHPERQMKNELGKIQSDGSYKACCLGELHILGCKYFNEPNPFEDVELRCGNSLTSNKVLDNSYEKYGLYSKAGVDIIDETSLTGLNDNGTTWPEIAEMIIKNPSMYIKNPV